MEEYLSFALVGFLGLILAVLSRSLVKMYERLWNSNNSKPGNPDEQAAILLDAINEANKLKEDRYRKRAARIPNAEDIPDQGGPASPPGPDTLENRVQALWDHYKELGGEG